MLLTSEPILGIDLGTTKSVCAIWKDGAPYIIPNAEGETITPSIVGFDQETNQWVVGKKARELALNNPGMVVHSVKRFMGRRFSDNDVQQSKKLCHILYDVHEDVSHGSGIEIEVADHCWTPQQISAAILRKLKTDSETYLGYSLQKAVVTVPANFDAAQRQATRDAGLLAGLDVIRVLSEPTSACLAYCYKDLAQTRKNVAVYDLGGGTFDISIVQVGRGPFTVVANVGNPYLGGDDIDWLIVDWMIESLSKAKQKQIRSNYALLARMRKAAEMAKVQLTDTDTTTISFYGLINQQTGENNLEFQLTRDKLDSLAMPEIEKTIESCREAFFDASKKGGIAIEEIGEVLLVGGQTRMPAVRREVREFFKRESNTSLHPEEVVALGAAVMGGYLSGQTMLGIPLNDIVPLTLGVEIKGGVMHRLIHKGADLGCSVEKEYSTEVKNQEEAHINVYQGERELVKGNRFLTSLTLKGIPPAEAGVPKISVKFSIDKNGILNVTAEDEMTGNKVECNISQALGYSDEEIKDMQQAAIQHQLEDMEEVQSRCKENALQLMKSLETILLEKNDKLSPPLIANIRSFLNAPPLSDWKEQLDRARQLISQVTQAEE